MDNIIIHLSTNQDDRFLAFVEGPLEDEDTIVVCIHDDEEAPIHGITAVVSRASLIRAAEMLAVPRGDDD